MRILSLTIILVFFSLSIYAQQQVLRGTVIDESSNVPVPFASVVVLKTVPALGAATDSNGSFLVTGVPVGRYDIRVSAIGYDSFTLKEVEVSASKEVILTIPLKENSTSLGEVVVIHKAGKEKPLNTMATLSARMLSVEEARRYAGGFDDPARLASSFAGVASNVGNNGIVVRGNSPRYLQWKMEGIEIPNPNHFADMSAFGGGGLTALSSNLLANSDFFTGAFPAEYGNALSGVFDMFMRNGNNRKHEHTFQLGIVGIDASSEGPFKKDGESSYLFNYRYSTLALLAPLLPENGEGVRYQDLSFKLNFPTQRAGTFSVWGLGLQDRSGAEAKTDTAEWKYRSDREDQDVKQYMGALGVSHKLLLPGNNAYLKTIIAAATNGVDLATDEWNDQKVLVPENRIRNATWDFTLSSFLNKKFSARHTNRTGILVRGMAYDLDLEKSPAISLPLQSVAAADGFSTLLSAYSASSIDISERVRINAGINTQFFTLNSHYTIEPRAGIKWQFRPDQSLAFAYGLHSRLEKINFYFNRSLSTGQDQVNKDMDFTKAHHLVLGYDRSISDVLHLKIEAYYQQLFHVPVIPDSSWSFINLQNDWFFAEKVENTGEGRNYGVDLTLEKYMSQGYYFLFTASLFQAEYKGGDGVWRDTRYNRNYLLNFLIGREWKAGRTRQNIFSVNTRLTYQGGDRHAPVDEAVSVIRRETVYDESRAFQYQLPASFTGHLTASYKINRKKVAHEIALKVINITGQKDFYGFKYNYITNTIDKHEEAIFIPNLSYRIEF